MGAAEQKWMLILTGVAGVDYRGGRTSDWDRKAFSLYLDTTPAIEFTEARVEPGKKLGFQVHQWAPFATINSIVDKDQAMNLGFAVDSYRPTYLSGTSVERLFWGLEVQAAVRDSNATLHRIGYQVSLVGKIVQYTLDPIP